METLRKLFVIGDVHGCLNELIKLLDITDRYINKNDAYVFLGDFVDRGYDSKGVIDLLVDRQQNHQNEHIFLRGNHEDFFLEKSPYWFMNGGIDTVKSYDENWSSKDIKDYVPATHWKFLNETKLFYKEGRTFCVHAGINPDLCYKLQTQETFLWERKFVGYEGSYHDDLFVVYGHTPKYEMVIRKNQLGIDTACVFGGKLTCAVIDPVTGEHVNTFQVKSEFNWK